MSFSLIEEFKKLSSKDKKDIKLILNDRIPLSSEEEQIVMSCKECEIFKKSYSSVKTENVFPKSTGAIINCILCIGIYKCSNGHSFNSFDKNIKDDTIDVGEKYVKNFEKIEEDIEKSLEEKYNNILEEMD